VQSYGVPGKQVVLRSTRGNQSLIVSLLFKQPTKLRYDYHDLERQKQLLAEVFAGEAWEVPRLLKKMQTAPDLYFDAVSQIRMQRWSHGRAVLLGDAGYCPALLSGQGSTLAMMGAYILAGELKVALGEHQRAFPQYEQAFRPVVRQEQNRQGKGCVGSSDVKYEQERKESVKHKEQAHETMQNVCKRDATLVSTDRT
jgi:2-polyprenyl-6-methoxyphenol hydroxylase-like FAD-dependent oxidoreductase